MKTRIQKLEAGEKYNELSLEFLGWSDGLNHDEYHYLDWFRDSVYLGPDCNGVEPMLSTTTQPRETGGKTMKAATARQKLESFVARQSDDMILAAITGIAKKDEDITTEQRVARCALLNEYEKRNGSAAVDALMDLLGL